MTIRFYKMLVMIPAMECHRVSHAMTQYVITKKASCGMGRRHKGLHASRFAGHVHFTVSDIDGGSTPLRDHPDGSGPITNSSVPPSFMSL